MVRARGGAGACRRQGQTEALVDSTRSYSHEFAWAYDLLQTDSVGPRVGFFTPRCEQAQLLMC